MIDKEREMISIKLRESNKCEHTPGDIILTRSTGKLPTTNKITQSAIMFKTSTYTHALLCLGSGQFIEATLGQPLLAFDYNANRSSLDSEEWKVLRYKRLSSEDHLKLFGAVATHIGKNYSLVDKLDSTFCSCFIAMVFNSLFPVLFKNPKTVFPVSLEYLPETDWEDVTKKYKSEQLYTLDDDLINQGIKILNFQFDHSKYTVEQLEVVDDIINKITGKKRVKLKRMKILSEHNWIMKQYLMGKKRKKA